MHPKQYLVSQLQSNVYPDSYTSMPTSQNHLNVIDKQDFKIKTQREIESGTVVQGTQQRPILTDAEETLNMSTSLR